jgi:phenylalanine-4-hydroxylase
MQPQQLTYALHGQPLRNRMFLLDICGHLPLLMNPVFADAVQT